MNPFQSLTLPILGALVVAALGLFGYHKLVVSAQQSTITRLDNENKQLKVDVTAAKDANQALDTEVKRIASQSKQMLDILKTVQEKDSQTAQWFEEARNALANQATADEIMKKLKEKPDDTIDELNKDIDCTIANFGKIGICKGGIFIPQTK